MKKNTRILTLIPSAVICINFIFVIPLPLSAAEQIKSRSRIAIVNFSANNTDIGVARGVRNSVEIDFFKDGSFDILEQSQIDMILRERKMQLSECKDEKCAAKIGELLKANYEIIGSVDKLGVFTVNVKVVEVKESKY
jgi:hypothetical protein